MASKKLSLSEYRTQKAAAADNAMEVDLHGTRVVDESTLVDYEEGDSSEEKAPTPSIVCSNDADMSVTSPS